MPDTNMLPAVHSDVLESPAQFEHMQRVAKVFCASALIPPHLRGNNGADAVLALAIAKRMGEDPVMVMQNIYVVHGRAGWSAQYMIARANRSGVFKGPISWRESGKGDDYTVTAFAKVAATDEEVSFAVSMGMAKAEGWTKNTKYQTLGPLMLRYRSATLLVRLYCPEVMMGMPGADELEDVAAAQMRDVTPAAEVAAALTGPGVTADGEVIDDSPGDNGTPSAGDASDGAGDTSQDSAQPPSEAPTPEEAAWDEATVKAVSRSVLGDLMKAKTIKAVDGMIISRGSDLAQIKRASDAAYAHIMQQASDKKTFLAASAP